MAEPLPRSALPRYQIQIDDAIRAEIQNALNAGKEVTVHERPITVSGWTGTGYIIADPATGAGAFKISGGANGGYLLFQGLFAGILLPATLFLAFGGGLLGVLSLVLAIELIIYTLQVSLYDNVGCYFTGIGVGLTLITLELGLTVGPAANAAYGRLIPYLLAIPGVAFAIRAATSSTPIENCLEF